LRVIARLRCIAASSCVPRPARVDRGQAPARQTDANPGANAKSTQHQNRERI
jgi:hypothetical protein